MTSLYLTRPVRKHEEVVAQIRVNVLEDARSAYLALRTALTSLKADDRADDKAESDIQEFLDELDNAYADSLSGALRTAENALADAQSGDEYAEERAQTQWKQVG